MVRKLRPNEVNLQAKKEWVYRAGGWAQFILQLFALKTPGVTANFKLVLIAIMDRVRQKGHGGAFPALERIADNIGVERTTVWRALKYWRDKGIIDWKGGIGVFCSNEYTLRASPLSLRSVPCCKLQPTHVANCNIAKLQTATLTSTQVITDRRVTDPALPDHKAGSVGVLVADEEGDEPEGGSNMPANRAFRRAGGGGGGSNGESAMDRGERENKQKGYYRKAKQAEEAWLYMIGRAKERMNLELMPLRGWEGQKLGDLIEADGYGMVKIKAMIDTLTVNWEGARKALRIKDEIPNWDTLVFYAQRLVVKKGEPFGAAVTQLDPDLAEKAKNAKVGEIV